VSERRKPGEFELIERYFAPLSADQPGAFGLTDDAAVLEMAAGRRLVFSLDTLVAGIHFHEDEPAETTAAKLLRVNLSDLAAMGAVPLAYTLSTALPEKVDSDWLEGFARGLAADQETFRITMVGGDTVSTPGPLILTLAILGTVGEEGELRRSAAEPGDTVYVSGTIGDGALGLMARRGDLEAVGREEREFLVERYRRPEPRLALGQRLIGPAHAAIDISDGLVADLGHVCRASSVDATIDAPRLPLSPAARAALAAEPQLIARIMTGGDDYELLFTAPPRARAAVEALSGETGVAVTAIGEIVDSGTGVVRVLDANGRELTFERPGYRHF
jgi:thiamine-monophosphate kinase